MVRGGLGRDEGLGRVGVAAGWGVTRAAVVRGGQGTRGDGLSAGCGAGSETRRAGA